MEDLKIKTRRSIGMFDSGIGGLTVMREVVKKLPNENIAYFGDTARLPYGNKNSETIIHYSIQNTILLIEKQNIKLLIIACNTASAHADDKLRQIFNIPIVDVIGPGAEAAVQATKSGRIGVLGTVATIRSKVYEKEILRKLPSAVVFSIACPLFVPLIEEGFSAHPATKLIIREYLQEMQDNDIDTLLLGCTHYPLLKKQIQEEISARVVIVDSAMACAEKVSHVLKAHQIENSASDFSTYKFYTSADPEKFRAHGRDFLGTSIEQVALVE